MALPLPPPRRPRLALRHRFVLALIAAVLIAGAVAAGMAVLLPPGGARAIRLDVVAAALRGTGDAALARTVRAGPPGTGRDRWLEVPAARGQLAALLRVDPADVRLMVASPVSLRRIATAQGEAGPIRAGFLPLAQTNEAAAAPPPSSVTTPPAPAVVTAPPAAAPVATPRPADVPRSTVPRPAPERPRATAPEPERRTDPPARRIERERVIPETPAPGPVTAPVPQSAPVVRPAPAPARPGPLTTVPQIEGRFLAALRLPSGGWAVVEPRPETMPTEAQQRMILWFLVALAVATPIAWAMAMGLVRPLSRFAEAAERSGRDPTVAMPDGMPSELEPAAAGLAHLQARVAALSRDRSAFAGTVRHELRMPIDRLRAGLEDAPRQIREAFHDDVADIDDAVMTLQLFLTDAVAPKEFARHDLGELMRGAAAAAAERGEPVAAEADAIAWVDVDPVAIGRLLDQLIGYARRQGGNVAMVLMIEAEQAIVAMAETARPAIAAFAPGLQGKALRASGNRPSGAGLAVARSIARAHGGEVRLIRAETGMVAELRLPLA